MKIELHMIAWNESRLLPFTLGHYAQFCTSMTVYDNESTDNTREIAQTYGAKVVPFKTNGLLSDRVYLELKNNCWKGSYADWVIVCDADEVLVHKNLPMVLRTATDVGYNMFETIGWNVYSDKFLEKSIWDITTGVRDNGYSKQIIFDPKALHAINYQPGAHVCAPVYKDWPQLAPVQLVLMHMRNLGGIESIIARRRQYQKRLCRENRQKGWGRHYEWSDTKISNEYYERLERATPLPHDLLQ